MNNPDTQHRYVQDLLGPYVLDALSREETSEVREHLQNCEPCRTEERDLREAHEHLSEFATNAEPSPPELKDKVFEELPRPKKTRRAPLLAAAAAVVAFVALGLFASGPSGFFATEIAVALEGTEMAPEASGELRLEPDDANIRAELEVQDLPRNKQDEYYELWLGKEGERVSAGTFTVDEAGGDTYSMNVPAKAADGYERVGVTLENFSKEPRMQNAHVVLGGEIDGT